MKLWMNASSKEIENMTIEEAIEILKKQINLGNTKGDNRPREYLVKALDYAVSEMNKAIPKLPIDNGNYMPKECPACGCSLSENLGDGYYNDLWEIDICPKCRQSIVWE